jgi:hypothetical protein
MEAIAVLGVEGALQLKARLADIEQCKSVSELVVGQPERLPGEDPRMSIKIGSKHRMIVAPSHIRLPVIDGVVNWDAVTRLKVIEIGEIL